MTTITTAIVSKFEATEIHPDKSKWSEAISEWKGPAVGFRDVTDEINNPLAPSEEAGTISITLSLNCPPQWKLDGTGKKACCHGNKKRWSLENLEMEASSTARNSDVCDRWLRPQSRLRSCQMKSSVFDWNPPPSRQTYKKRRARGLRANYDTLWQTH